ncbi:CPBP family intramembrane glutamic endopeptidase [Ekhidna sp.]|uniref:CPBP family intramembrane glutamic endopeptidase n=1 Tax=Ekhidna sp. TaxID=2608089 RepID=UPI003CCBCF3B
MNFLTRFKKVKSGFIAFLKSPDDHKLYTISDAERFKDILIIVILQLLIMIPLAIVIGVLEYTELLELPDHKLADMIDKRSIHLVFFAAVILAPIVEETLFRGFITFQRFYPLLFIIALAGAVGKNQFKVLLVTRRLWDSFFPFLALFSVLIFGYMHVWNFEEQMSLWLIPIAISPQFIAGLFLTYARVRYGLIWSMLAHASVNFTALFLYYAVPLN